MSDDIRAGMAEIFDKMNKEGAAADAPSPVASPSAEAEPVASPEPVETPEEGAPSGDRARGPDGKFIKAEKPAEGDVEPPAPEKVQDQPVSAGPSKGAPGSWSPAARDHWDALPLPIKEAVLKRESEMGRLRNESGERVKAYQELDKVLEPVTPLLNMQGVSKAQYVGNLIRAEEALRNPQTKHAAFQYLANQYGFDLRQLQPAAPQAPVDPQIASLQQRLDSYERAQAEERARQEQALQSSVETDIQAFIDDPANEFVNEVRPTMAHFLRTGVVDNLKDAYELACTRTPEIASIIEARRLDEMRRKLAAPGRQAAGAAKKVALANVSGAAGASPGQVPTLREGMSQVYDRLMSEAS